MLELYVTGMTGIQTHQAVLQDGLNAVQAWMHDEIAGLVVQSLMGLVVQTGIQTGVQDQKQAVQAGIQVVQAGMQDGTAGVVV